jgi:hypothetical protein
VNNWKRTPAKKTIFVNRTRGKFTLKPRIKPKNHAEKEPNARITISKTDKDLRKHTHFETLKKPPSTFLKKKPIFLRKRMRQFLFSKRENIGFLKKDKHNF